MPEPEPYNIVPAGAGYGPVAIPPASDPAARPAPPQPEIIEAEWVQRFAPRRRFSWARWLAFVLKLAAGLGLAWLFYQLPSGNMPNLLQTWKNPVVIFLLICFIGKTLLDTFFFDHYGT